MSNQIELRHLRYLVMLAEELHFKKAAERLFISQPGLSRQIKQLELIIGTDLFERDKKHVALTKAGAYVYKEASFLINTINKMTHEAKNMASGLSGNIRIGFVGSAMQNVIPDLILKSNESHPGIKFSLEEMPNKMQEDQLVNNDIDLGFVRLDHIHKDLISKTVYEDTFSIVVPSNHKVNNSNFKSVAQFKDDPFILFEESYSPTYHKQIMSICQDHGFTPKIAHNSVHASTIYRLVENKLGVSIVPSILEEGFDMDIDFIPLNRISQRAVLSVVWNKRNRNPALPFVIDIIQNL